MFKRHGANAYCATPLWRRPLLWLATAPILVAVTVVFERNSSLWAQTASPRDGVEIPTYLKPGSQLKIDSSETKHLVNDVLRSRVSILYSNATVEARDESADDAIQFVLNGGTNLATVGRPLTVPASARGWPWWPWLLALPLLGGLLWWLLKDRTPIAVPLAATADRRISLTPRNCRDAYATWELPEAEVEALRQQNCSLALKLHDVTDIADVDRQAPHSTYPFDCETVAVGGLHLPVTVDNRDYLVELGYVGSGGTWHALVRSAHVRVPACPGTVTQATPGVGAVTPDIGVAAASLRAAELGAAAIARPAQTVAPEQVILTPHDCKTVHAHWELPQSTVDNLKTGSRTLKARLYDVTKLPGNGHGLNSLQEFNVPLAPPGDLHLPIAIDNRDYLVEIGYVDSNYQWHTLAKSEPVRVPACAESAD